MSLIWWVIVVIVVIGLVYWLFKGKKKGTIKPSEGPPTPPSPPEM